MSSVARLVRTYFTRTPGLRWLTFTGALAIVAGPLILPRITTNGITDTIAFLGGLALFVGAGLMPMRVAQMARSHAIFVLPYGRLKLFLSALITVAIVSAPLPLLVVVAQWGTVPPSVAATYTTWRIVSEGAYLFWSFYVGTFLAATWLYVAVGFATTERNVVGLTKCLLIVIATIYAPTLRIVQLDPKVELTAWESILSWSALGAWIAWAPRWRAARARRAAGAGVLERFFRSRALRRSSGAHAPTGREFDLLLGTAHPWILALAMLFPIAIQTLVGFSLPETWLFYLTLFSAVSGALAGRAAERSRSIWLRARWSREELFARVEAAFWKHNSYALVLLLILLVAVVRFYELPARVVPLGIPLLVLGMVLSTYLGLAMTRGLRWIEASLAISIMLALMGVAVLAAGPHDARVVVGLEVAFGLLALTLRFVARHRWQRLDWTLCRPDRTESARAAA
jgi:hypothetical protein